MLSLNSQSHFFIFGFLDAHGLCPRAVLPDVEEAIKQKHGYHGLRNEALVQEERKIKRATYEERPTDNKV